MNDAERLPVLAHFIVRVSQPARDAGEYLGRIKRESEEAEALRRALEEERAAVAEKYNSLEREAARRETERQQNFEREMRAGLADFERRAQELTRQIEDRAERARVEREAERRSSELRREAQRVAAQTRTEKASRTIEQSGGVRVVRNSGAIGAAGLSSSPSQSSSLAAGADEFRAASEAREIEKGDHVRLRSFGKTGTVESIKGAEAEVRVGNVRLREKVKNLELLERAPVKTDAARLSRLERMAEAARASTQVRLGDSRHEPNAELNLIGKTTDEARDAVDKLLDEAYLHSLPRVRIIHGHGTGALRRAVAELLKGHPHVANFAPAPPNEGGAGATVVELKQ